MTDFRTEEISVSDGRPIELYQFEVEGSTFRFTNGERTITKDSQDFLPTRIIREAVEQSNKQITGEFVLTWGLGDIISATFLSLWVSGAPETDTVVTVFKQQVEDTSGEFITFWTGSIKNVAFKSNQVEMLLSNVGAFFSDKGPRLTWGGHCGHNFGDSRCRFVLSAVTYSWTISVIAADGITITVSQDIDGAPFNVSAGDLIRGEMIKGSFSRRYITLDSVTTNQFTLLYPLVGLAVGNQITVIEGCPHNTTACNDRFSNIENYGGTPYTPNINPFERSLDKV